MLIDLDELIVILESNSTHSTMKELARRIGVSPQYLSDIIAKRREPGPKILKALGYTKVVAYETGDN